MKRRTGQRGMSLIELMMVTAIIGILAVLAAVGYGRWISSARMAEATEMVAGIKNAQENYFTQAGKYFDVSTGVKPGKMHPKAYPNQKTSWKTVCDDCTSNDAWQRLGIKSDKPVYFGYATVADGDVCDPACKGISFDTKSGAVNWDAEAGGPIRKPWYIVTAAADTNGNGKYAAVIGFSFGKRMIIDNEGE